MKMRTRKITPAPITPNHSFTDIRESWLDTLVTRALSYDIITRNTQFFPDRSVSRSEAYSMIIKSVCMPVAKISNKDWTYGIYTTAKYMAMTTSSSYAEFRSDAPISRTEMIVIASRAADWAEDTGGCNPKPEYCFLD